MTKCTYGSMTNGPLAVEKCVIIFYRRELDGILCSHRTFTFCLHQKLQLILKKKSVLGFE